MIMALLLFIASYIMVNLNSKEKTHAEIKVDSHDLGPG